VGVLVGCGGRASDEVAPSLAPGAEWFDDWYTVARLDAQTFAIAEPRYEQHNVNYLIVGDRRAVLFDTGPGVRDIRPVVASLTDRPVTAAFSHLHYDHIGDQLAFDSIASLDHPAVRARVGDDGLFTPTLLQFGGTGRPTFRIGEWWTPDAVIDLGGRSLRVLSVPGHTPESLALYDAERGQLFTGDYLYRGDLFAFVPGSDVGAYLETAHRLLALTGGDVAIYGAHVATPDLAPRQSRAELEHLAADLEALLGGHGPPWTFDHFEWIPTRRYAFDDGTVLLTPLL
jgi:glyoxylase-like metal-dependent hydrolase (beta-lactamase superfamily II)